MDTNNLKNDFKDGLDKTENAVGLTSTEEPATKHDVGIGGGIGAVGGAIVGALAGGPVGAIIGAIAGGVASAGAVDVVDKHDNDFDRTNAATTGTQPYSTTPTVDNDYADADTLDTNTTATGYTGPGDFQRTPTAPAIDSYATPAVDTYATPATASVASPSAYNDAALSSQINNNDADQTIQLREEQLSANKQAVQTGEVTLRKEVITETRSIDVPVTREEVVIERHAVSGTATAGSFDTTEEVIRVPVMEEQVTLQKTPVVTEEISLGKRQVTETQHLTGTVRHEEARIENPGNVDVLQNGAIGSEVDEDETNVNASRTGSSSSY